MFLLVFTAVPFVSEFVPDKEGEICILVILGLVGVTDAIRFEKSKSEEICCLGIFFFSMD